MSFIFSRNFTIAFLGILLTASLLYIFLSYRSERLREIEKDDVYLMNMVSVKLFTREMARELRQASESGESLDLAGLYDRVINRYGGDSRGRGFYPINKEDVVENWALLTTPSGEQYIISGILVSPRGVPFAHIESPNESGSRYIMGTNVHRVILDAERKGFDKSEIRDSIILLLPGF